MMQQLEINKPGTVTLADAFDTTEIAFALHRKHLEMYKSADGVTEMYTVPQGAPWNHLTLNMDGLIVRNGLILARHMQKFFLQDTEEFPETKLENCVPAGMEATLWVDGYSAVLYESLQNAPMIALRGWFTRQPALWASTEYRKRFVKSTWPDGYSPNFVIVHPDHAKTVRYKYGQLILVALVNKRDGTEMPFATVEEWGKFNDIHVMPRVQVGLREIPGRELEQKGLVLRWEVPEGFPLRVGVYSNRFQGGPGVAEQVTPLGLWELLKEDADLSPLYDSRTMPEEFCTWVKHWEGILNGTYQVKELEVTDFWNLAELDEAGLADDATRKDAEEFWTKATVSKEWVLPVLLKMFEGEDAKGLIWDQVREVTDGQKGWNRS
jgi:hypothetical protein